MAKFNRGGVPGFGSQVPDVINPQGLAPNILQSPITELSNRLGVSIPGAAGVPELGVPTAATPTLAAPSAPSAALTSGPEVSGGNQINPNQQTPGDYGFKNESVEELQRLNQEAASPVPIGQRIGELGDNFETTTAKLGEAKTKEAVDFGLEFVDRIHAFAQEQDVTKPRPAFTGAANIVPDKPTANSIAQKLGLVDTFEKPDFNGVVRQVTKPNKRFATLLGLSSLSAIAEADKIRQGENQAAIKNEQPIPTGPEAGIKEVQMGQLAASKFKDSYNGIAAEEGTDLANLTPEENAVIGTIASNTTKRVVKNNIKTNKTDTINYLEITPAMIERAAAVDEIFSSLFKRVPKPVKYIQYDSNKPKPKLTREYGEGVVEFAARVQASMPWTVSLQNAALYTAIVNPVVQGTQANPDGTLSQPSQIPGASLAGVDANYFENRGPAAAAVGLGKSTQILKGLSEDLGRVFTKPTFASKSQNRIYQDVDQHKNSVSDPILRQIHVDPKMHSISAAGSSAGLKSWKAVIARSMHSDKETGRKEGDFTPTKLREVFDSSEGEAAWSILVGDPAIAIQQVNAMQSIYAKTQNGEIDPSTPIPIPDFITKNPDKFLNDGADGFKKAIAMIDFAKYQNAKAGGASFLTQFKGEMDGNANGPALMAYYTGNTELAKATGINNSSDVFSFDGDHKIRELIGENLTSALEGTVMLINDPLKAPTLRRLYEGILANDGFRKALLTPVGYGFSPDATWRLIDKYLNENLVLKTSLEQVLLGTDANLEQVSKQLGDIGAWSMKKTLGADTFDNYIKPLNKYALFAMILNVPAVIKYPDGATAVLYDSTIERQVPEKGQEIGVTFYDTVDGQETPKATRVPSYVYSATPDATSPGPISKNKKQRPGYTAISRGGPVNTHNVDAAIEREDLMNYNNGSIDYSYDQIFDANYVPASEWESHMIRKNANLTKTLEQQDPLKAAAGAFSSYLKPENKKYIDSLPNEIPYDKSNHIFKFLERGTGHVGSYIARLLTPSDLVDVKQEVWIKHKIGEFYKAVNPIIGSAARDGHMTKSQYVSLMTEIIKQFGGQASLTTAYEKNKATRTANGFLDANRTQYS